MMNNLLIIIHPCILFFINFESMLASFHKTAFLTFYTHARMRVHTRVQVHFESRFLFTYAFY